MMAVAKPNTSKLATINIWYEDSHPWRRPHIAINGREITEYVRAYSIEHGAMGIPTVVLSFNCDLRLEEPEQVLRFDGAVDKT